MVTIVISPMYRWDSPILNGDFRSLGLWKPWKPVNRSVGWSSKWDLRSLGRASRRCPRPYPRRLPGRWPSRCPCHEPGPGGGHQPEIQKNLGFFSGRLALHFFGGIFLVYLYIYICIWLSISMGIFIYKYKYSPRLWDFFLELNLFDWIVGEICWRNHGGWLRWEKHRSKWWAFKPPSMEGHVCR